MLAGTPLLTATRSQRHPEAQLSQPTLTPAAFAAKWRVVTTTEKASAQYKGKYKDLKAAYVQLLAYKDGLGNPPLLIVSDIGASPPGRRPATARKSAMPCPELT